MKNYRCFLNESLNPIKYRKEVLQILKIDSIELISKKEDKEDSIIKPLLKKIYDKYCIVVTLNKKGDKYEMYEKDNPSKYCKGIKDNSNRRNEIDFSIPIMNTSNLENFISNDKKANIYNKVEDFKLADSKKLFTETFKKSSFIPKTVFSLDDIETLKLPIIAKPNSSRSAQGIEKFDSYEDAKKSKLEFDLWSEAKDLDREFRAYVIDDNIVCMTERITNTKNDMSVGKKDADEKIDLVYLDIDFNKFEHLKQVKSIIEQLSKKVKLSCYAIDLMLDNDGVLWVPEINGAPAFTASTFYSIYKAWIKLIHNKTISSSDDTELLNIRDAYIDRMKELFPKEYKTASNPL